MKRLPLVSIIIPNYNGSQFITECLNSVILSSYKNFEVILVDDGSSDSSVKIIKRFIAKDKRIRIFKNSSNLGAAASRNRAIALAKGEIIVFLDNDTKVEKEWLRELILPLVNDRRLGSTNSMTINYQHPDMISTAGLLLIPHTGWGIARGSGESTDSFEWNKSAETVAISAALAVKKDVLKSVKGFDEKLAVHTEDLDFCWRIWLSGQKMLYVPKSRVYHWSKPQQQRERLMNATLSYIYFHINKNTIRTLVKNYSLGYLVRYLPMALIIMFTRGLLVLINKRNPVALIEFFKSIIWNIKYLSDTLYLRGIIQSSRKVSDDYLREKIMTNESLFSIYRNHFA